MSPLMTKIIDVLKKTRFPSLTDEKRLQQEIFEHFISIGYKIQREVSLSPKDRVDFMIDGLVIEVKVKGSAVATLNQVERYAAISEVKELILLTTKNHGFPSQINGKPVAIVRLGSSWL